MSDNVGLGLAVNIVFWTLAVLVVTGLAILAVIDYFPGRERKGTGGHRASVSGRRAAEPRRDDEGGEPERFRKAS